jgi:hypothetical protein
VTTNIAFLGLVEIECSTPKQEKVQPANANLDTFDGSCYEIKQLKSALLPRCRIGIDDWL